MALQGRLKVVQGFVRDKDILLPTDVDFTIGREKDNMLPVMSRTLSRKHAKITFHNGAYAITDLESKTGTLVNQRKVTKPQVLRHNDLVEIGAIKFKFLLEDSEKKAAEAAAAPAVKPVVPKPPVVIAPKPAVPPPAPAVEKKALAEIERPVFTPDELAFVGKTLGGIKLIAALGKGRRTVVFKGIQSEHNRVVAFKILTAEAGRDADAVRWFVNGARRSAELRHEDIVSALGGGRDQGIFFIFTPFMENGSAQERFATAVEDGVPSVKRALESLVHLIRALEFGQGKGALHLGLRPSKVLFNELKHAKINALGFDNRPLVSGGRLTPDVEAYLAPEQVASNVETTALADIFSLGATFFYMLTGRRPERDHKQRIPSPKLINKAVPDSICRIFEKMVDPTQDARYRSYGQLLHDVRWALRGEAWPHT